MVRRLFLHAGTAKTGTTSIQHWFDANRDVLKDRGTFYPRINHDSDPHPSFNRAQHILAFHWGVGWLQPEKHVTEAAWQDLADQVRGYDGDVVLSSETFALAVAGHGESLFGLIRELLPEAEVTCVFYLRDHADLIRSDAFEGMRNGQGVRSIYRHATESPWYLKMLLETRAMVRGAMDNPNVAHTVLRPFEKGQMHRGRLLDDFCRIVGIDDPAAISPVGEQAQNQFHDSNAIYLMLSQISNLKFSKPRLLKHMCYDIAREIGDTSGRFDWGPEFSAALAARYAEERAFLDAYCGGSFFQETRDHSGLHSSGIEDRIAHALYHRLTGQYPPRPESYTVLLNQLSELDYAGKLDY